MKTKYLLIALIYINTLVHIKDFHKNKQAHIQPYSSISLSLCIINTLLLRLWLNVKHFNESTLYRHFFFKLNNNDDDDVAAADFTAVMMIY